MLSNGTPTRTFCYVADAIVGYYKVLVRGEKGEAYNVGVDGPETSIGDLAERFVEAGRELFGYQGSVVHQSSDDPEYLTDNPNRRCPDISKACTGLDYNPQISLEEGLRRSLLWYAPQINS
jgi:nucleoside-diphosphate-sugar epimerase